jgi:hypothetical protein
MMAMHQIGFIIHLSLCLPLFAMPNTTATVHIEISGKLHSPVKASLHDARQHAAFQAHRRDRSFQHYGGPLHSPAKAFSIYGLVAKSDLPLDEISPHPVSQQTNNAWLVQSTLHFAPAFNVP